MDATLMDEEWAVLASLLPEGWRELARETGAMRRARGGIQSPEVLLQLLLLHVATGLSLKQTAVRAHVQKLASVTDVALLKRLRSSEDWLREMARRMFDASRFATLSSGLPAGRRLRAVDATTVEEPGATGTDWRVHYCISLPDLRCDYFELTDVTGAETYKRLPISPGDIILGDRGYSHREGVAHVLRHGGDVVVRLNSASFPLLEAERDRPFDLIAHFRRMKGCEPREWPVRFKAGDRVWNARVCAIRKSRIAAEHAKKVIRRVASKKGKQLKPGTLEYAEYIFVLTTLDESSVGTRAVLDLYRARWQIELCFKRLKSLLRLGHLPKRSDESARAWIQGKLLTVLLVERLIERARFFSPWGFELDATQSMA
ncbi:MAG: IS4 family transposase [Planctomycetes bacterium]|nr:IS4 family transposase [Planctomycetota bacterium]